MTDWLTRRARELRTAMTDAERKLWQVLRDRQLDHFKFRRQMPIGRYVADFVCPAARLVVEVDGGQHGTPADADRDRWFEAQGFRVLRVWNNEVERNIEGVYARVQAMILDAPQRPVADVGAVRDQPSSDVRARAVEARPAPASPTPHNEEPKVESPWRTSSNVVGSKVAAAPASMPAPAPAPAPHVADASPSASPWALARIERERRQVELRTQSVEQPANDGQGESKSHPHPNPSPVKGEGLEASLPRFVSGDVDAPRVAGDGGVSDDGSSKTRGMTTHPAIKPTEPSEAPRRAAHNTGETRIHGLNACLAAFAARPHDLRKVYLLESRLGALRDVIAWCVQHRLGYRIVEDTDLSKLAASSHHEGVCFDMQRKAQPDLAQLLGTIPASRPACLLWLDGVGNPHNFGAVLRSAAHFGVAAVLLPPDSTLTLSGAACRVAEGGAEAVAVIRIDDTDEAITQLRDAGFTLAATLPRDAVPVYDATLPARTVFVLGAEGEGMGAALIDASTLRLTIPGTGRVESLNIANATGVLLSEYWRRHAG